MVQSILCYYERYNSYTKIDLAGTIYVQLVNPSGENTANTWMETIEVIVLPKKAGIYPTEF